MKKESDMAQMVSPPEGLMESGIGTTGGHQNVGFQQFVALMEATPHIPRKVLAEQLHVTRQTIQVWLRTYRANRQVGRRGRPGKFGSVRAVPFTIRLPVDLVARIGCSVDSTAGAQPKLTRQMIELAIVQAFGGCELGSADGKQSEAQPNCNESLASERGSLCNQ